MRLLLRRSDNDSQPSSSYNLSRLEPFQQPVIARPAWYWIFSADSISSCKETPKGGNLWHVVDNITVIKMGANKSFIHLIKSLQGQEFREVFQHTNNPFCFRHLLFRCRPKENLDWSIKPKCLCSSTFVTAVRGALAKFCYKKIKLLWLVSLDQDWIPFSFDMPIC